MSVKKIKTNKELISEVSKMLNGKALRFESFYMGEEGMDNFADDEFPSSEPDMEPEHGEAEKSIEPQDKGSEQATLMGVKDEINQIRTIALKTIARLSDYPTSEGYGMMKKIWNMCDKAMEPTKETDKNGGSMG